MLFTFASVSKVKSFRLSVGKLFLYPVYRREVVIKKFEIQGVGVVREKNSFLVIIRRGYTRYRTICREDCDGVSGVWCAGLARISRIVRVAGNKRRSRDSVSVESDEEEVARERAVMS